MRLIDVDTLPKLLDAEYKQTMKLIREGEKHLDTLAEGFTEASHIAKYIAPTVDAVPVVRCRDCKHLRPEVDAYTQETVGYWCAELDIGSVDVDGFCNRGERKETDHE